MTSHRRSNAGFSLAELIVACGILASLVSVALGIFPFSQSVNQQAWDLLTAQDLASAEMEQMRAGGFDTMPAVTTVTRTVRNVLFTCVVTTAPYGPQPPINLRQVSCVVTWTSRQPGRLTLDSLVARMAPTL